MKGATGDCKTFFTTENQKNSHARSILIILTELSFTDQMLNDTNATEIYDHNNDNQDVNR